MNGNGGVQDADWVAALAKNPGFEGPCLGAGALPRASSTPCAPGDTNDSTASAAGPVPRAQGPGQDSVFGTV